MSFALVTRDLRSGAMTAYIDEKVEDVAAAMSAMAEEFSRAGSKLGDFEKRAADATGYVGSSLRELPYHDSLYVQVLQRGDWVYGNACREVFAAVYCFGLVALLRLSDWAVFRAYTVSQSPTYTVPPATAGPEPTPPPMV
jgi:hypothetical protein